MAPTCPSGHQSGADDYCDVCGIAIEQGPPRVSSLPPQGGRAAAESAGFAGSPGSGRAAEPAGSPGAAASAASPASPAFPGSPGSRGAAGTPEPGGGAGEACPRCGAPRFDRFCEDCGYDFVTGTGMSAPATEPEPPAEAPPELATNRPLDTEPAEDVAIPAGTWIAVIAADREYYQRVLTQGGPDAVSLRFPPFALERRLILTGSQVRIGRRSVSRGRTPEIDLAQAPEDPGVSHLHAVLLAKPDNSWVLVDPGSTNGTTLNEADDPIEVNVEIPLKHGDRIYVGAWTSITLTKEG